MGSDSVKGAVHMIITYATPTHIHKQVCAQVVCTHVGMHICMIGHTIRSYAIE